MPNSDEKFSIKSLDEGFFISKGVNDGIQTTERELIESLIVLPYVFLKNLEDEILAKKKELYEKLKPAGFEYSPAKAKEYRQNLENVDDVEQMKYLSTILSYNQDDTIELPTINETFCVNLTGGKRITWTDAKELAEIKGYHLLSDWNDCDSESEKQSTDRYRLEHLFGKYNDKKTLICMLGFFDRGGYWTNTQYYESKTEPKNSFLMRRIEDPCRNDKESERTNTCIRACGFKNSLVKGK